jgi:hypothetical protein
MKPGPIIGLLIGIGLMLSPAIGLFRGEASFGDPFVMIMGILGLFMVIVNIIAISKGTDDLLASNSSSFSTPKTIAKEKLEGSSGEEMVRCRFCKKRYSSEYNGCPYCKKK